MSDYFPCTCGETEVVTVNPPKCFGCHKVLPTREQAYDVLMAAVRSGEAEDRRQNALSLMLQRLVGPLAVAEGPESREQATLRGMLNKRASELTPAELLTLTGLRLEQFSHPKNPMWIRRLAKSTGDGLGALVAALVGAPSKNNTSPLKIVERPKNLRIMERTDPAEDPTT